MTSRYPEVLSAANPLATEEQREIEALALRLLSRPELQRARATAALLWRSAVAHPAREQMTRFDNMIEEYVFHYTIRAANSDALQPRIARFMAPAHQWFGHRVPGSRWAGDSPDFIYRFIPIEHGGHYELSGRYSCDVPPLATYALMANTTAAPVTQFLLDSLQMSVEHSGEFVISIGPDSPDQRPNYIQTRPGADHLFIRDALGDWTQQTPNALRIRRIEASSSHRRAPTEQEMAERAARTMLESFYYTYYCTRSGSGQPPNHLRAPASSAAFGGLATQWGAKGNLYLNADDALIVTANAAGALFRNVMLTDAFHMSIDYWSHTSSLNMTQMAADDDGRFTYVVSHRDPGVHNWLDAVGLRETIFGHRWQAFAPAYSGDGPILDARLVRFQDLECELPPGVRRMDEAGRRAQLEQRLNGFERRFLDR